MAIPMAPILSNGADEVDRITRNQVHHAMTTVLNATQGTIPGHLQRRRGQSTDPRKNIDEECGYPTTGDIRLEDYQRLYDRLPEGRKVVTLMPRYTWQISPAVYETEDDRVTPFEEAYNLLVRSVGQNNKSWHKQPEEGGTLYNYIRRWDEQSGIGHFGSLLNGLNDGKKLHEPVDGIDEVTGEYDDQPSKALKERKLLYLRPLSQSVCEVKDVENDPTSPRYGAPKMYRVTFRSSIYGGSTFENQDVHWTRIVHFADNLEDDDWEGVPRQRPVFNELINLYLFYGCSAEMFYNGAFPPTYFSTHPQLGGDVIVDRTRFKEQQELIMRGLQRYGLLMGLTPTQLQQIIADPSSQVDLMHTAICLMLDIPKRIWQGSERGELSSAEDADQWDEVKNHRRIGVATPQLLIPFIDRQIAYRTLPPPESGEYTVDWETKENLSPVEKADVGLKLTQSAAAYVGGGVESLIPRKRYLTKIWDMTEEEADATIEEAKAQEPDPLDGIEMPDDEEDADNPIPPTDAKGQPVPPQQPTPPKPRNAFS